MNKDEFEEKQIKIFINKFMNKEQKTVLDFGCGDGRILSFFLRNSKPYFKNMRYIGLDKNSEMIKKCKYRFPFESFYDVSKFNFNNYKYDIIIFSHVLEHIELNEMMNIFLMLYEKLNDNGYIILMTPYERKEFYTDYDHLKPVYCETIENISKMFNLNLKLKYKKIKTVPKKVEYQTGKLYYIYWKIENALLRLFTSENASQFGVFKKEKKEDNN